MARLRTRSENILIPDVGSRQLSFLRTGGLNPPGGTVNNWNRPPGGTGQSLTPLNVFLWPTIIRQIDDVVGNMGGFNPVRHITIRHAMSSLNPWYNASNGELATPSFEGIPVPNIAYQGRIDLWPWLPEVSAADLSGWAYDAYTAFEAQVPTTVSLPNFLYELREMKSMIPSIDRGSLSKTASNNFLGFEFGVKPFISDIQKIVALSDSVQKRIKYLLEQNGKSRKLTFKRKLELMTPFTFFVSVFENGYTNYATASGYDYEFVRTGASGELHIGADLFQDLQGLSDQLTTLKALSSAGGFNKPARVIWNAIPYSFVVDWFFSVGKLLDTLTVQPFGGTYKVSNVGYSVKTEATYIAYQRNAFASPMTRSELGTVNVKSFRREPGFPMTGLLLSNWSLDPKKQVLALAMLEQRRR